MSVKDGAMLTKFKDGIQDTVVFLRMLEQFKIPAVMETRRKKLLQKLLVLQGDTIRETPPSYENEDGPTSPQRDLTRKGSVVENKVSEYARIETKAQVEMKDMVSPKKKAASPPPATVEEKTEHEPAAYLEPSAAGVQRREKDKRGASSERPSSAVSAASSEGSKKGDEEQVDEGIVKETKKKRFGTGLKGLKNKLGKRSKKTTSTDLAPQQSDVKEGEQAVAEAGDGDTASVAAAEVQEGEGKPAAEVEAEGEEEEVEEGVRIKSELEKRVQKRFGSGFNWVKITGKLKDTTLTLTTGNKAKQLELVGCTVSPSDAAPHGIELFSHREQKQWVFRVENERLREQWVQELQTAIDECPIETRPPVPEPEVETSVTEELQGKPEEDIPAINVEPAKGEDDSMAKKKRPSFAASASPSRGKKTKPVSEIPDQGIQMKGYVYRKKGTFGGWEKAYCVVTFAAIYFTTAEDTREYHHMCMLGGTGTVKREKKGHDKQSESLFIKSGKSKETLSLAASEVQGWKDVLENVLGVSQMSLELDSDEEDEVTDIGPSPGPAVASGEIEEDLALYEELPAGTEDDFGIEEDIYEEFDDVPRVAPAAVPSPSLPARNEIKPIESGPALPPRNEITRGPAPSEPLPSLPPRASPNLAAKFPQKGAIMGVKKSPEPPQDVGGEELYEDIVAPQGAAVEDMGGEELYEDVVTPQVAVEEELYEDVVGAGDRPGSPTEDYTEMDVGHADPEGYVLMERNGDDDGEVYCEVDPDEPPPHAAVNSLKLPSKGATTMTSGAGKIQKPPPPVTYVPKHSGNLSHKAPKKSRFYEEWCAVEGTNLCTYKTQKDKRTTEKISLSEFDMYYSPGKGGKYAFRLSKGDKVHRFNLSSKEELSGWVAAMRGSSKSTTLELPAGEQQVFQATQDHIADSDEQISFKTGTYIRVISEDASEFWIGQLGNDAQVFSGKIGKFPVSKTVLAEDLYI